MTTRTHHGAWGLAAILAVLVLAVVVGLGVTYRTQLLDGDGQLTLLPREEWGFGRSTLMQSYGPDDVPTEWFVVGCFAWRLDDAPPPSSTGSGTGL